ncbi:hypothetical protein N3K66_002558 [Trichothecium roseum]|uniref:Uncharacterized protein n=1 Tax=Trichothecium roseum TaxID=47278 RepID=A0ACC0V9Q4_9HYPO|nr:hypothetical protein N3K66_002558 [Trichothecium roseum]
MSRRLLQTSRMLARSSRRSPSLSTCSTLRASAVAATITTVPEIRSRNAFSTSTHRPKGIMPETANPKHEPAGSPATVKPADITENEYHELADTYLENALLKFEEIQDKNAAVDVEFSAGVMTIGIPGVGTYVLNKQPPNKQIWLSSPVSGPKRYDWCVFGEGQTDKEGTAAGRWVYTRDQSTLDALVLEELDVDLQAPIDS